MLFSTLSLICLLDSTVLLTSSNQLAISRLAGIVSLSSGLRQKDANFDVSTGQLRVFLQAQARIFIAESVQKSIKNRGIESENYLWWATIVTAWSGRFNILVWVESEIVQITIQLPMARNIA